MTDRAGRQPCVRGLPKQLTGPLTQLLDRWATGRIMAFIHHGQQANIFLRIATGKALDRALTTGEAPCLPILVNQSRELLAGIPTDFPQIAADEPFLRLGESQVLKLNQGSLNPLITFIFCTEDREGDGLGASRNSSR